MKRVAILTKFYKNYNYGGMLQGYALHRVIKGLGYDCDIVSYNVGENSNPVYKNVLQQCKQYGLRAAIEKIIEKSVGKLNILIKGIITERKRLFDDFMENSGANTELYNDSNLESLNDRYDCFVSGSDQVWNPNAVRRLFLQDFVAENKSRVAYAASIGRSSLSDFEASILIPHISRFDHLGIREKTGTELLKRYIDKDIKTVLDPTMLLSIDEWDEIASNQLVEEPYALFYFFSDSYTIRESAEVFCKKHGLKMVLIPYAKQEFNFGDKRGNAIQLEKVGPYEFLSAIKHAEYVFTDSFHGAVFSIIFRKQFVVYERNKNGHVSMNSRLYDLLDTFELRDRIINSTKDVNELPMIDFDTVGKICDEKKEQSLEFLKSALV